MTNRIAILGALALLAGCPDDTDKTATGDTAVTPTMPTGQCPEGVYDGPTLIQSATVTCSDDESTVLFELETEGWTTGGTIFSQETRNTEPQYADEHDLDSVQFDPCGYWDQLEQELNTGVTAAKAVANESTVFSCVPEEHFDPGTGPNVMTYAAAVYDFDGNFADCMVWGHDPQGLINGDYKRLADPSFAGELGNCFVGKKTR